MVKLPSFLRKKPKDPEVEAAYQAARREGVLERAKDEGYKAGKTKSKSLMDKIGDFGEGLSKDLGNFGEGGGSNFNFDGFLFGEPTPKRKTKKKKRKKR